MRAVLSHVEYSPSCNFPVKKGEGMSSINLGAIGSIFLRSGEGHSPCSYVIPCSLRPDSFTVDTRPLDH